MKKNNIKTLVLRTAGTNCDKETLYAFKLAGSQVDLLHVNELIKKKEILKEYHIFVIPGGFSYGDDIASGKVLANEIKFNLKDRLSKFVMDGKLVLGICNGFQVLVKMGFLPNIDNKFNKIESTLSLNNSGKFDVRWVYLKKENNSKCIWTKNLPETIYLPIAHAEGKFIPKNNNVLKILHNNQHIVFYYSDKNGNKDFEFNPNGSIDNIAGICDSTGRILGMMPHPERHITYLQHPNWRRENIRNKSMGIGLEIFKTGVNFIKNNK